MQTLSLELRNILERTVIGAREEAEAGAKEALEALAIHHYEPYSHMDTEARALRRHIRARTRQIGDKQDKSGRLEITHIIHECAYEYWHRMLFARFLAENDLLIDSELGIAITLTECEELARDAGVNTWVYASRCAQQMLPQIFRPDDPLMKISFAADHRIRLEELLDGLAEETFYASDAIGWVYQFWQSKKKQQVNASGNKIGADELPAVTQFFTEDYMVDFLLDNTLGAWWAGKRLANQDLSNAQSEEQLRKKAALPGCAWSYLRFVKDEAGTWRPAAGIYDGWPKRAAELKCFDPCCGSGHFLIAMLKRLVPMRMEEERLSKAEAVREILADNLYGLEIDPRCTQLAAFSLALMAWRLMPESKKILPKLNIACCGLEFGGTKEEWIGLAPGSGFEMELLYKLFQDSGTLGSLIDPSEHLKQGLIEAKIEETIHERLKDYRKRSDFDRSELAVTAAGSAESYRILTRRFHFIATNVPYLSRNKQNHVLKSFIENRSFRGKQDLATVFLERCLDFLSAGGCLSIVTPEHWLMNQSYEELRKHLLYTIQWRFLAKLGPSAFQIMNWWAARTDLLIFVKEPASAGSIFTAIDLPYTRKTELKSPLLLKENIVLGLQSNQLKNPDCRIRIGHSGDLPLLGNFADVYAGIQTGDYPRYIRYIWELAEIGHPWEFFQRTVNENEFYGGREQVINWDRGRSLSEQPQSVIRGTKAFGKKGICINRTASLAATLYTGELFDQNAAVIIPRNPNEMASVWSFLSSKDYRDAVRELDTNTGVTPATLVKVDFDQEKWKKEAVNSLPAGIPDPLSNSPSEWIFDGIVNNTSSPLNVAVARLLSYHWPNQKEDDLFRLCDEDGIVCIPSVRGEEPAADRLLTLLRKTYSHAWSDTKLGKLIALTGSKTQNLDDWLRKDFFEQHCKLFHHRPFILHIWDGRMRDGFHALVRYHKLAEGNGKGRLLLEKLVHAYLGDWITRQKDGVNRGEDGAEGRFAAALELQKRLNAILRGEPPFDLFIRWKPIHKQPIGWEPDINDGVRLNVRSFMADDLPDGVKGAGILRWKPNTRWGKDRGKEPHRPKDEYPWFWGWDESTQDFMGGMEFDGNRWNNCHYTNECKELARKTHK